MNLALFSKLQDSDTVSLILRKREANLLDYFLVSSTVSHEVVTSGVCQGEVDEPVVCFNIKISFIRSLIGSGVNLNISYFNGNLKFTSNDGKVVVNPLYVEYRNKLVNDSVVKFIEFLEALEDYNRFESIKQNVEVELASLEHTYNEATKMNLSGGPSLNPFEDDGTQEKLDKMYQEKMREVKERFDVKLNSGKKISKVNFKPFAKIANYSSKIHGVIDFCETFAVMSIKDSLYLFQKGSCPVMSIPSKLLSTLIKDNKGEGFYLFEDDLVYFNGTSGATVVFITHYLPGNVAGIDLITRGAVQEKYKIKLKRVLKILSLLRSNVEDIKIDLGSGNAILSNNTGEEARIKIDVLDAQTVELNKMMKGESNVGEIKMSTITISKDIQFLLTLFQDNLIVYVKKNKVIFQNDSLYMVFSR